jgi:hypothetical protein
MLEYLFKRIEPVDEWIAMRLAFLLLDIYMSMYRGCAPDDQVRTLFPPSLPRKSGDSSMKFRGNGLESVTE